jgi:hypothetical protein
MQCRAAPHVISTPMSMTAAVPWAFSTTARMSPMSETLSFELTLEQLADYEFKVKFDWPEVAELLLDEPPPLGGAAGPKRRG